jgi:hypothetical protein
LKGFDSSAAAGVYMVEKPAESLDHLEPDGTGIKCKTKKEKRLINTDDSCVHQSLVTAGILLPSMAGMSSRQKEIYSPTAKSLYTWPAGFDKAAEGYIVAFRPDKLDDSHPPYYVDKKFLDFQTCTPITIEDFDDCDQFNGLVRGAKNVNSMFPEFLGASPTFKPNFIEIAKACMGTCQDELQQQVFKGVLRGLTLETSNSVFGFIKNDAAKFNEIMGSCGCELKRRSALSGMFTKKLTLTCSDCEGVDLSINANRIQELNSSLGTIMEHVSRRGQ